MTLAMLAGAACAQIRIPAEILPIEGFTEIHDELHVRVLIVDDGSTRIVIVALELTSIFEHTVAELQQLVAGETDSTAQNVIVCATHTFSAPHIPHSGGAGPDQSSSAAFATAVRAATTEAAARAAAAVRRALVGVGVGSSAVNTCKDVQTPHGWWLGSDEYGSLDRVLTAVHLREPGGNVIAVLFSQAVPSAVMSESTTATGGRLISADLAGAAAAAIEVAHPGAIALFLCGAAGDQTPAYMASRPTVDREGIPGRIDAFEDGFALVDILGAQLGRDVLGLVQRESCTELDRPLELHHGAITVGTQSSIAFHDLRPMLHAPYTPNGTTKVPFVTARIGPLALVGTQAELASLTSCEIRAGSSAPATIIATMVNGAAKYMVDAAGYDKVTYGAMNSRYQQGAAEHVRDAVLARI